MTYKEFIQTIIEVRGQWGIPDNEYYENHHIIPKCLGGSSDTAKGNFLKHSTNENCIRLYPKEHYIAHKLLAEENPTNYKLIYAWHRICVCKKQVITAEEYEKLKLLRKKVGFTDEHRYKIGKANTGKKRPDLSEYNSKNKKGKKDSASTRLKKCKAQSGDNNNNAKKVINIDTGIIFGSLKSAAESVGGSKSGLCCHLRYGKKSTYKGFHWKYVDK